MMESRIRRDAGGGRDARGPTRERRDASAKYRKARYLEGGVSAIVNHESAIEKQWQTY